MHPPFLPQARFIEQAQALLHGDLHTGSLMVTQDTTYAIDPEFAYYGPMAFDVGKIIVNLLLCFFALDGHASGGCCAASLPMPGTPRVGGRCSSWCWLGGWVL